MTDPNPVPNQVPSSSVAHRIGAVALWLVAHAREIFVGRMSQWLWVTLILVGVIFWLNAELIGPIFKVLAKITMAASVGYAIDRTAFPYARPHEALDDARHMAERGEPPVVLWALSAAYQLRRALIIGACVIGSTIGL